MGDIEYDERIICRCCGGTVAGKSNMCRTCADLEHDRSHEDGTDANRRAEERQAAADGRALILPDDEDDEEQVDLDEAVEAGDQGAVDSRELSPEQAETLEASLNEDADSVDLGEIPGETDPDSEGGDPTVAEQLDEADDSDGE